MIVKRYHPNGYLGQASNQVFDRSSKWSPLIEKEFVLRFLRGVSVSKGAIHSVLQGMSGSRVVLGQMAFSCHYLWYLTSKNYPRCRNVCCLCFLVAAVCAENWKEGIWRLFLVFSKQNRQCRKKSL